MISHVLIFVAGMMAGGTLGCAIMALFFYGSAADAHIEEDQE